MKWLEKQLDAYGSYHTKLVTKITHFIGVPLVIFSLLICLAWFKFSLPPLFSTNFAWIVVVIVSLLYLYVDWRFGLCLAVILLSMAWVASLLAQPNFTMANFILVVSLFITGWVIQLAGHFFEGKKPAFLDNSIQLFIAPLFLVAEAAVMMGLRKDLTDIMHTHSELHM